MLKENENGSNLPQVFTFNQNNQHVRVEVINDEPWFINQDICKILGISKDRDAFSRLDEDERGSVVVDTLGGKQTLSAVNESGLYNLIFQSRKPEAKAFRKWVTSEVLPAIRKGGKYSLKGISHRDCEFVDLRQVPYEFRTINESQVRVIIHEDIDWYNINDLQRGIGASTGSCQIVKKLNNGNRTHAIKILIFGNTQPSWFTSISGVKLILSGSRKMKHNKQNNQLQITIGGLV